MPQMCLHRWPFALDDAEHHRVSQRAVVGQRVVAQNTVLFGAQPGNRFAALEVEVMGSELDRNAVQLFKCVLEQYELAFGI